MSIPAVLVERDTRAIILRGNYPRIDGAPVDGYGANDTGEQEWLIIHEPVALANVVFDNRYRRLQVTESATTTEHPLYPGVNQFMITYSTPKLEIPEILVNLEAAENNANHIAFPYEKQLKYLAVSINAIRKMQQDIPLQQIEQDILTKLANYVTALAANRSNALMMKQQIENSQEPDLDSGWVTSVEE